MRGRRGGGSGGRGCGAGGSGPGGGRRRRGPEERGTGGGGGVGGGGGWAASPGATNAEARPHPPANRPPPLPGSLCGSRHRCARSLGPPRRHLPPIRAAAHREDRRRGDRRGGVMHQQIQHGAGGAPGVEGAAAAETGHGWRAPRAFVCTAAAADTRPRRRREAAAACDTQSSPPPPCRRPPPRRARAPSPWLPDTRRPPTRMGRRVSAAAAAFACLALAWTASRAPTRGGGRTTPSPPSVLLKFGPLSPDGAGGLSGMTRCGGRR